MAKASQSDGAPRNFEDEADEGRSGRHGGMTLARAVVVGLSVNLDRPEDYFDIVRTRLWDTPSRP